ncbi:IL10RA isoform 3 [Pongo abelii]|uniref:IL10RA isoform 3 n=1 Tax=Pongo abelii TaxID=9601 RepID=A0A2J8X165_PONAB|nr:IL10RA isoform 3 [Pongo abelii]
MLPCLVVLLAALLSLRLGSDAHALAGWPSGERDARVPPYSGKPGSQAHLLWKWKRLRLTGTDGLGRIEKYAQGQTPNPQTSSSTHF